MRALSVGDNVPAPVPDAVRDLAEAVWTLDEYLDDPAGEPVVSEPALRAAAQATLVLEQTANLSVSAIVVQVRATAVDLMCGWGLDREEAERRVHEAARVLATGEHRIVPSCAPPGVVRWFALLASPSTSTRPAASSAGCGRPPGSLHLALALLIVAGVVVQVYLIGGYIFGAGDGALDAHTAVGWSVHTCEMLLFLAALAAWLPRGEIGLSLVLAVLGTVQVLLSGGEKWVGALHPLLALLVLGLAGVLAQRGLRRRRRRAA